MAGDQRGDGAADALAQEEAALIQAARNDLGAFGPLYARYVDRIYAYLRARTAPAGMEEAADLTQQVFLRALDALPRFQARDGISVAAWLFRIARNAATDWQRRTLSATSVAVSVPWQAVPEEQQPRAPESADEVALRRETIAEVRRLLATLDEAAREALLLRFAGQLSLAEIGAVVGASEEATRKRITRALHALKERTHDDSDDTP